MPHYAKTRPEKIDPRVVRTRKLLLDGFQSLLGERRSIRDISIQDITERAGVNRVTFYAHFTDKIDLLDEWKRDVFHHIVGQRIQADTEDITAALEQMVAAFIEYFIIYNRHISPVNREFEPLFEVALEQEIYVLLLSILDQHKLTLNLKTSQEETATFLSWAIFGSIKEWTRNPKGKEKREFTDDLSLLIRSIIS